MMGYFPYNGGVDILSILAMASIVIIPSILWKKWSNPSSSSLSKRELALATLLLSLWLGVSIFLVTATKGACVCFYNNSYGMKIGEDV
jgi:phosphoglycerol transferase MdoB-like AlkP superfamily enzyme